MSAPRTPPESDGLNRLSGVSSVLFLAPSDGPATQQGCLRALADATGKPTPDHVVGVAHRPDDAFFDRIASQGGEDAAHAVVAMGGTECSHDAVETVRADAGSVPARVRELVVDRGGDAVAVCFAALPALVEDIGLVRTFRFVNGFVADLRGTDAIAHFHLDPDGHDSQALDALTTVFDAVVRAADDDWEVAWTRDA